jgi:hypothetical protein
MARIAPVIILAVAVLASAPARAAELVPKYGFEKAALTDGASVSDRMYALELSRAIGAPRAMRLKAELGGWIARAPGRESAQYLSAQWGYRAEMASGLYFEAYIGPGYVTRLDTELGSHAEIFHDVNAGFIDAHGFGLAFGYKHISNGGYRQPNRGRDFGQMRFVIPLGGRSG